MKVYLPPLGGPLGPIYRIAKDWEGAFGFAE
jgi:hypothetical protein